MLTKLKLKLKTGHTKDRIGEIERERERMEKTGYKIETYRRKTGRKRERENVENSHFPKSS